MAGYGYVAEEEAKVLLMQYSEWLDTSEEYRVTPITDDDTHEDLVNRFINERNDSAWPTVMSKND